MAYIITIPLNFWELIKLKAACALDPVVPKVWSRVLKVWSKAALNPRAASSENRVRPVAEFDSL